MMAQDHNYARTVPASKKCKIFAPTLTEADFLFYTSVSADIFKELAKAITVERTKRFNICVEDQLLMTPTRLHLGLLYGHLSRIFEKPVASVHSIVKHTLFALCKVMKKVVLWLPRETIRNSMPPSFINSDYEGTTCISDCTEIFLHGSRKLMPRAQTYSKYKAHNTVKFLMAIAPNGYIMYVSDVYGGRASDKFITADCGIEDLLGPGDEIMANRGFSLSRNLELQGVKLNIPTFTKGKE
ncbi:uncharacterized protein LOC142775613 [Rhipicephalus microplus]|uniref:uncharacterized protein LOC142775613 n=1 Tax=Rhipicephalus microplus TaxID=6941 RepID=UPI003F6AF288